MRKTLLFLCFAIVCWTSICLAYGQPQPLTYVNARYGFSLNLPPWFYAAQEADNGDGVTITDPTVLEIRAYGTMVMTPPESFDALMKQWSTRIGHVKKRIVNKNEQWFFLEGVQKLPADSEHSEKFTAVKVLYGPIVHKILHITYYGEPNTHYPSIIETAVQSFNNIK